MPQHRTDQLTIIFTPGEFSDTLVIKLKDERAGQRANGREPQNQVTRYLILWMVPGTLGG